MKQLFCILLLICGVARAEATSPIRVDQFGYMVTMPKIAFWVDAVRGFNAGPSNPPPERLYLVNAATDEAVSTMQPVLQNEGRVHEHSGDRIWQLDFSHVQEAGRYFIADSRGRVRSWEFRIDQGAVFKDLLRQALRTFYYQRCGLAKQGHLNDSACHLGPGQDAECTHFGGESGTCDLRGGWHDAGDYNKYVGYVYPAVKSLLNTYLMHPALWREMDLDIPESGNGVPDILDEVKWGLDWLLRMQVRQSSDRKKRGGVRYLVSSELAGGAYYREHINKPASQDRGRRAYLGVAGQSTTAAASLFAYGAYVFRQAGISDYADELERAALLAWQWAENNPGQIDSRFPKQADLAASNGHLYGDSKVALLEAALYLHLLTGDAKFAAYARTHYRAALRNEDGKISEHLGPALLYYTFGQGADRDIAQSLQNDYQAIWIDNEFYHANREDPYLNPNYGGAWWGSHGTVCSLAYKVAYGEILGHSELALARSVVAGSLGYIHGRNPMDLVYLTNVGAYGAEHYLDRIYHSDRQIAQRPPPGFLPGGPNPKAGGGQTPLSAQPALKAFDPAMRIEPTYEYFEGQLAIQAHYVQLLSAAMALFAVP